MLNTMISWIACICQRTQTLALHFSVSSLGLATTCSPVELLLSALIFDKVDSTLADVAIRMCGAWLACAWMCMTLLKVFKPASESAILVMILFVFT